MTVADRRLNVAVVTFNSGQYIEALLDSLAGEKLSLHVVVVDNGSVDDTLAKLAPRNDVTVISAGANLGYSGGINLAHEYMLPDAPILVVNPDLVLESGSLTQLLATLDADPDVGICVPQIRNPDGTLYFSLRREPTLLNALGDALLGARWPQRPARLNGDLRTKPEYQSARDVHWASGAALLVSRECDRTVGPWNSADFFMYAEETDYAARAREAGFRIRYVPTARAIHHRGGSGTDSALVALLPVNRVRYYSSRHCRVAAWLFRGAVTLQYGLRMPRAGHQRAISSLWSESARNKLPKSGVPRPRVIQQARQARQTAVT